MTWQRGLTYSGHTQDVAWLVEQFRSIGATSVEVEVYENGQPKHRAVADFTEPRPTFTEPSDADAAFRRSWFDQGWSGLAESLRSNRVRQPALPDPDPVLDALLDEEEQIARSGAHAPDLPDAETELGGSITYRSTGRGAYDVVQSRAEGPDVVLAMVQFTEGVRGRVHALEAFIGSLRQTSQDTQP